jgi:hypothetical protein
MPIALHTPSPAALSQSSHPIIIALKLSHILYQSVTNEVGLIGELSPKLVTLPLAKSSIDQATVHALLDDGVKTVRQEAGLFAFNDTVPASTWEYIGSGENGEIKNYNTNSKGEEFHDGVCGD